MTVENPQTPNQERQRDLDWIDENRTVFWLAATVAWEQYGFGAIFVDTTPQEHGRGQSFDYYFQGEIYLQNVELHSLVQEYDPHREFVIVLIKPDEQHRVYRCSAPEMGWWLSMETQTRYPAESE